MPKYKCPVCDMKVKGDIESLVFHLGLHALLLCDEHRYTMCCPLCDERFDMTPHFRSPGLVEHLREFGTESEQHRVLAAMRRMTT